MLISFSASNFKSILEPISINMLADENDSALQSYLYEEEGNKFNPISIIWGPNGSGKSSLLDAFKFVKDIALCNRINKIPRNKLASVESDSRFEVCFTQNELFESYKERAFFRYILVVSNNGVIHETFKKYNVEEWDVIFDRSFPLLDKTYKKKEEGSLNVDWVQTINLYRDDSVFDETTSLMSFCFNSIEVCWLFNINR